MTRIIDTTNCPVCGQEAPRELDTDTNEMTLDCEKCGFSAETEIVKSNTGKTFWLSTKRLPMDESGRVIRGTCVAQVAGARWWVPSLNKTVTSVDQPTADATFIKNVVYLQCGKPGVRWDEHADIRSEDEGGWLCEEHAGSPGPAGEEGVRSEGEVIDLTGVHPISRMLFGRGGMDDYSKRTDECKAYIGEHPDATKDELIEMFGFTVWENATFELAYPLDEGKKGQP